MEKAFIVIKDSEFYNDYFKCKKEKELFLKLGNDFLEKNNLLVKYYRDKTLGLELDKQQKELYKNQIKKYDDTQGMSIFKKNSKMNIQWQKEVIDKIDFKIIDKIFFWSYGLCGFKWQHNLWSYKENIYGYLQSDEIKLPNDTIEIKMSEYYKIIEESEK